MDPLLKKHFTETITLHPFVGYDEYGQELYGDPASAKAYIERRNVMVRTMTGEEKVSSTQIWVTDFAEIDPHSKLVLANGLQPLILSTQNVPGLGAQDHIVVYT